MSKGSATHNIYESYMPLLPGDDIQTSLGLQSDPGKYCIVVNYVVLEAMKIKFKPTLRGSNYPCLEQMVPWFQYWSCHRSSAVY